MGNNIKDTLATDVKGAVDAFVYGDNSAVDWEKVWPIDINAAVDYDEYNLNGELKMAADTIEAREGDAESVKAYYAVVVKCVRAVISGNVEYANREALDEKIVAVDAQVEQKRALIEQKIVEERAIQISKDAKKGALLIGGIIVALAVILVILMAP